MRSRREKPGTGPGLSTCSHRASHSLENGTSPKTGSRLAEVGSPSRGVAATLDHSPHPSYNGPCCGVVAGPSLTGRSRLNSGLVNWVGTMKLVQNRQEANRCEHPSGRRSLMQKPRFYLTVPFAQKDKAKGLGAKWDPTRKSWYVPEGVDTGAFQRWISDDSDHQGPTPGDPSAQRAGSPNRKKESSGVVIPSTNPDFVPYTGDVPPWE